MTPEQKSQRARMAVHASWAKTTDPSARTSPARKAFMERFENEVDPDRVLPEAERERRATHAMKSYMAGLSLKASRARTRKPPTPFEEAVMEAENLGACPKCGRDDLKAYGIHLALIHGLKRDS